MAILNSIAGFEKDMAEWSPFTPISELGENVIKLQIRNRTFRIWYHRNSFRIMPPWTCSNHRGKSARSYNWLKADMDALPIKKIQDYLAPFKNEGVMHACGHDGHTAMLLGAARYLAETRNFSGRVALIFQPDEEATGGAKAMVEEGIIEHLIDEVYALQNIPARDVGVYLPGPIMACG